jgi:hypothetical protein
MHRDHVPLMTPSNKPLAHKEIPLSIAEVQNAIIKGAVNYWQSLCGQRQFPEHRELTLRGMAAFLRFSVIVDVIDDGADYRYRYVGDAERQAFKVYFKGITLSQVETHAPAFGRVLRTAYEHLRASGVPFVIKGPTGHAMSDSTLPNHETAFLPLGSTKVEQLLIVGVQIPRPFLDLSDTKLKVFADLVPSAPR